MRIRTLLGGAAVAVALVLAVAGPAHAQEHEETTEESGGEEHAEISHAAEECIELLEEGSEIDACQEAPNPILPETNEIIWGGLSFLILFALLAKFGYPAIKAGMDARSERIKESIDEAESTKAEAQTILADYQRQLADARNESARIIEEARQTADAMRRDQEARLQTELDEMRQRNSEQIAAERDRVMSEISGQVKTLAIELAEKVVEANLDRDANLRIIENYINSVNQTGAKR